ncbi:diguanylate cyclase domain-containing protein [Saccharothrix xinjiangensis]|uniref:Diguanylate cyclase domain-containing protein n=1 Tax=Saccharothrix xinjiangensis TaxID=204798 RepID=A0ABV9YB49_9PSEU
MTEPGGPDRTGGSAPPDGPARQDPAEVWARALAGAACAPVAGARTREDLEEHLALLVRLLTAVPFDPDGAGEVGTWLVAARFTGPDCLRRTIEVLGRLLPDLADAPADRVITLLGAVAAGYAGAARGQVFTEQEQVRSSLLRALERARDDLHDSEARFRQVFASSAVGIAIFDADGAVVEANPALVTMLGPEEDHPGGPRPTGQLATEQGASHPDATGQDTAGQDTAGQDATEQDTAGQDTAGQDTAGPGAGQGAADHDPGDRPLEGRPGEAARDGRHRPSALFTPEDLAALRADQARLLRSDDGTFRTERRFTGPNGDPMWTNVALSVVRDADGHPKYHVAVVEDTTEQRVLREYLRHQALHDVLTGLPNRQGFLPALERALARPGAVTLCYLGVHGVGVVNDGLGYEAGDELLKAVARRLTAAVAGETATVARLGGDEFAVLVEDSPTTPGIPSLAAAIEAELAEPVHLAGRRFVLSAAMGFVRTATRGVDPMALLRRAHSTLRRAERGGRGQWEVYDEELDTRDRERLRLGAALADAVASGDVNIDYPPVERDGARVAVAARLRWQEGGGEPVGHDECLRFADELGVSGHLAAWLLDEACSFAAVEGLPVLVALSPDQSRDPELTAPVAEALRASALPPPLLWLALSARGLAVDPDAVEDNLTTLADMGVRRLLHGFTCALPELSVLGRQLLHGVVPVDPPPEPLAREALAAALPLVRSTGALVVSDGRWPGADLVARW